MESEIHFLAVDPGDTHQGVVYATARLVPAPVLWIHWTRDLSVEALDDLMEVAQVGGFVMESWHLYPEQARNMGYSTFPTVERIGVAKRTAKKRGLPIVMQPASMKRDGRRIGERLTPELGGIRTIQTTRGAKKAWDWNCRTQHERDAVSHATAWSFTNKNSPLYEYDLKRQATICL